MDFKSWKTKKTQWLRSYIKTIRTHRYSSILSIKSLVINTGKYLQYIWLCISLPFFLKIPFIFMATTSFFLPLFFRNMVMFFYLLYSSLSDSLRTSFFWVFFSVPLADVSLLCPNSGCFSFPFFICFLSLLLADRWGLAAWHWNCYGEG